MLESVEELFEFALVFARQDDEAAGETVAESVEGDGFLALRSCRAGGKLGIGAVGDELGWRNGSAY
jgi:hypothetical protein